MSKPIDIKLLFSDYFGIDKEVVRDYGAFDISLNTDLPLFVDPFLLFNSGNPAYQQLHANIIKYLRFLCERTPAALVNRGLLDAWFRFKEIKQNWFGFSKQGNAGHGLGRKFAESLCRNLHRVFTDFGNELK